IFGIRHAFDYGAVLHPHDFLARVARAARRPILAMAESTHIVNRVLVAYDGSRAAADALRSFAILHAFDPELVRVVSVGETGVEAAQHVDTARAYLEAHDYKTEGVVVEGNPAEQILAEAKSTDADLIVLGAVGRSGIAKFLVGDTASNILAESSVSLFLRH
ncbi:MAG: universal stress protein, partial [Phycisphaerales bacterium]|nr:universal stress protein [Phycisphaerales bacterium]